MTTAGVVTWRLPRLDGLYRRAGQLVRAVLVFYFFICFDLLSDVGVNMSALADGQQQFVLL